MPEDRIVQLTEKELTTLMEAAVGNALTRLGVDVNNPLDMQKDFQHLRDWRTTVDMVQRKGVLVVVTMLISGLVAAVWIGMKAMIQP